MGVHAGVTRADLQPSEGVTPRRCSECDASLEDRGPQATTCSARCRQRRSRRRRQQAASVEQDPGQAMGTLYGLADGAGGPVRLLWRPPSRPLRTEPIERRLGVELDLVIEVECTMDDGYAVIGAAPRLGETGWYDNGPELGELVRALRPEPEVPTFVDGVCSYGDRVYRLHEHAGGTGFYHLHCDGQVATSRKARMGRPATPREAPGWARSVVLSGWPKEAS